MKIIKSLIVSALLPLFIVGAVVAAGGAIYVAFRLAVPEIKQEIRIQNGAILLGVIQREFRIITAKRDSQETLNGLTQSVVPGSKEEIVYQAFYTAEAQIDLSDLKAEDITVVNDTAYFLLPQPTIRLVLDVNNSKVLSKDSQLLSGFWSDPNLIQKMQQEARLRILDSIRTDGSLLREARANGEEKLRILLGASGYKVVFAKYQGPLPIKPLNTEK